MLKAVFENTWRCGEHGMLKSQRSLVTVTGVREKERRD